MEKEDLAGPIYSVAKALSLLEEVGRHPDGIRLNDISAVFKLEKSSVFRILETLENNGFLIKASNPVRYMLGLKLFRLGMSKQAAMPFRRMAVPFLKELRNITGETSVLATIESHEMFYLDSEEASATLRCSIDLSRTKPVFCDAFGKILLAFKGDEYASKYFKNNKPCEYTRNTRKKIDDILKDFNDVRTSGFALDHEEHEAGIHSIAVPIISSGRFCAASIGIIYPVSRYTLEKEKELVEKTVSIGKNFSDSVNI